MLKTTKTPTPHAPKSKEAGGKKAEKLALPRRVWRRRRVRRYASQTAL